MSELVAIAEGIATETFARQQRRGVPGKRRVALDISNEMLDVLQETAKDMHLSVSNLVEYLVMHGMLVRSIEKAEKDLELTYRAVRFDARLPCTRTGRAIRAFKRRKRSTGQKRVMKPRVTQWVKGATLKRGNAARQRTTTPKGRK